jgi:hypothetical protein
MFLKLSVSLSEKQGLNRTHLASYDLSDLTVVDGDGQSAVARPSSESEPPSTWEDSLSWDGSLRIGSNLILFCRSRLSYLRKRSSKSRSGNLRLRRRVASVAGTHFECDLTQLEHGSSRLHLTLRC